METLLALKMRTFCLLLLTIFQRWTPSFLESLQGPLESSSPPQTINTRLNMFNIKGFMSTISMTTSSSSLISALAVQCGFIEDHPTWADFLQCWWRNAWGCLHMAGQQKGLSNNLDASMITFSSTSSSTSPKTCMPRTVWSFFRTQGSNSIATKER